jgi:hypothetical protein
LANIWTDILGLKGELSIKRVDTDKTKNLSTLDNENGLIDTLNASYLPSRTSSVAGKIKKNDTADSKNYLAFNLKVCFSYLIIYFWL